VRDIFFSRLSCCDGECVSVLLDNYKKWQRYRKLPPQTLDELNNALLFEFPTYRHLAEYIGKDIQVIHKSISNIFSVYCAMKLTDD